MGQTRPISGAGRLSSFIVPLLLVLLALAVRLPWLADRPFHTDEAVNVFILEELWERGYQYRAHDHHGPLLHYLNAGALPLFGVRTPAQMEAWMLRLVSALAGAALVCAVYSLRPYISAPAAHASAALLTLAAPFVYYSGIYIHETLLVLLLLLYVACLWRGLEKPALRWTLLSGILAGLMLGTKETAALLLLVFTAVLTLASGSFRPRRGLDGKRRFTSLQAVASRLLVIVAVALGVVVFLYSDLGRHPSRALDLFAAIGPQVGRGLGDEHAYPWWTYLSWAAAPTRVALPWSGWVAATGLLGLALARRDRFLLGLGCAGVLSLLAFSALPYKTPWLMLAWLLPFVLLAGHLLALVWKRNRIAATVAALAMGAGLASETHAKCGAHGADPENPLAYSPTSPDQARLGRDLEVLVSGLAPGRAIPVHVIARDYWPLPWTLRRFPNTGYWSEPTAVPDDAVVFTGPEFLGHYATSGELRPYELRPGVFIFLREPVTQQGK